MIGRRTFLGGGLAAAAAVTAVAASGRSADLARRLGVRPHPEPDPDDVAILQEAARTQTELIAAIDARLRARAGNVRLTSLRATAAEQVAALQTSGSPTPTAPRSAGADQAASDQAVGILAQKSARESAAQCLRARSPELSRVLGSLTLGRVQIAAALGATTETVLA